MASYVKAKDSLAETTSTGEFKRTSSTYRAHISKDNAEFPPEFGRYHLYICWACPWANRCATAIKMKGLEDCIGISVVHPTWQKTKPDDAEDSHYGWAFHPDPSEPVKTPNGAATIPIPEGCTHDKINNVTFIRNLYEMSNDTGGKYSVPVLWDTKTKQIVNNESSEILRMLTKEFDEFATGPNKDLDLYPEALRAEIDAVNEWIYPDINNGVYRCGFARSQAAYDEAVTALYAALDKVEDILSKKRYLTGKNLRCIHGYKHE
jgi:putative glutathione S-transferase